MTGIARWLSIVVGAFVVQGNALAHGQVTDTLSQKRGVVKIVSGPKGQPEEVGAGLVIARQADTLYVLTAAHVIQEGDEHPRVSFYSRQHEVFPADRIVGIERRLSSTGGKEIDPEGVAVLRIQGNLPPDISVLPLAANTEHLHGGEDVKAIGFPVHQERGWLVSIGSMTGEGGGGSLLFSGDISAGNSGGPLLHEGYVVGVVMVSLAKRQAVAVPTERVRLLLKEWKVPMAPMMPSGVVLIPKGTSSMGVANGPVGSPEFPAHTVLLDAFLIDQHETTVRDYRQFLDATHRAPPAYWDHASSGNHDSKPVVGLTWLDAKAYCEWRGKRLPTEAEWEKAARGTDGRSYPWGDSPPTLKLANFNQALSSNPYASGLRPIGSFDEGKSQYGIFDMAGNAWEWVEDWYDKDYYTKAKNAPNNPKGPAEGTEKVLRGGSWLFGDIRSTARDSAPPQQAAETFGVRCAQDAK